MGSIVGLDGKALRAPKPAEQDGITVHKWQWRGKPKCSPERLCPGMLALLTDSSRASGNKGHRLTIVGEVGTAPDGTKSVTGPEAIGLIFQTPNAGPKLLMFNYCPACGNKIPLVESRDV